MCRGIRNGWTATFSVGGGHVIVSAIGDIAQGVDYCTVEDSVGPCILTISLKEVKRTSESDVIVSGLVNKSLKVSIV